MRFTPDCGEYEYLINSRLAPAVVGNEETSLLKDAAADIASDGAVVLERDVTAVGQLANPFGVNGGGERRVWR